MRSSGEGVLMVLVRPQVDALPPAPSFASTKVSTEVRDYIQHVIMTGRLDAGDRLRVEHLAEHLNLSVTPVREALVELLADGFVERRPRRGYVVAKLTQTGFEDRILVLAMVDGELAARAASKITTDQLSQLSALQATLVEQDSAGDRVSAERAAHHFHRLINLVADSPELAWTAARFARYVPRFIGLEWTSRPRTCTYEHDAIIAALSDGDERIAREVMFTHLTDSTKMLSEELARSGLWD
jgi:DNA-binding GntR family transcriptional regulator